MKIRRLMLSLGKVASPGGCDASSNREREAGVDEQAEICRRIQVVYEHT